LSRRRPRRRAQRSPRRRSPRAHSRGSPSPPSDRAPLAERASRFQPSVIVSRTKSAELVQAVLDKICDAAARGETVKLSSFGSFVVRSKGQRIGRIPKTGVEAPILPRRVMAFKPSNVLKARVNGGSAAPRNGTVTADWNKEQGAERHGQDPRGVSHDQ